MNKTFSLKIIRTLASFLMAAVMLVSLCSCNFGGKKPEPETTTVPETTQETTEETTESEPTDLIDLDGLEAVEEKDTSSVKITKKEVLRDASSTFSISGNDALTFTVTNNSGQDVTEFTIYTVGYTEKNGLTKVQKNLTVSFNSDPYLQVLESTDTTIKAGQSEEVSVLVNADDFAGVKAIVASYKTADGKVHDNSITEEWTKSVQLGKNTTLD